MKSLSGINLYGQLMALMLIVWSSNVFMFFTMASYDPMKFQLLHYGITWNSCFFSFMGYYEPNIYFQFYLISWLHVFPQPETFRISRLLSHLGC